MATLVRGRLSLHRGQPLVADRAPALPVVGVVQVILVVVLLLFATAMARGYGS